MTELRGRTARWSAAALAAPVVASLFAGTTAWAVHHDPLHPAAESTPPAAAPAASPTPDPTLAALKAALIANATKVDTLSRQVAAVRAQAVALSTGRPSAARTSSGGTSRAPSSSSARSSSGGGSLAPIVVRLPAAAPAAAPPTQTSTGASGVKK